MEHEKYSNISQVLQKTVNTLGKQYTKDKTKQKTPACRISMYLTHQSKLKEKTKTKTDNPINERGDEDNQNSHDFRYKTK